MNGLDVRVLPRIWKYTRINAILKNYLEGGGEVAASTAHNFSIETDMPSYPCALLGQKLLIILIICSLVTDT